MMNKLLHTLKGEKNGRGGKWLWRQLLFLVMFLSAFSPTGLMAQVNPVIDGNPIDWNSANFNLFTIKQYTSDAFGNGVVDNQFTEGSKDFFFANQLVWSISQTKAKNDIANAAAIIKDGILYFAGDRTSNNGDAQIGFWLYLNGTGPVTVGGNNIFSPPHVDGDVLILADFTGGGRTATVTIYQWDDDGVAPAGQTIVPNTNNNLRTTNLVGTVAENNDNQYPIPTGWSFIQPTYDYNMFFEGTVNLTGLGVLNLCNTSFILETRSSQSITASLDDFAGGAFNVTPPALVLTGSAVCASAPGTGTITSTTSQAGASYQLFNSADQPVGPAKPGSGSGLTWTGVPIGTGYYVVGSGSIPSCTSTSNEVDVASIPNPPCEITGNNVICAGASASFTATGGGAGATYAWTGPGGYTANTATISGLTVAGTYTVVITNTTGCTSTCNRTLTVNPNPGCEITGNNVICAGASASFTASGGAAGATYAWTGPGGYTANTATISGLTVAGTYTVVITNTTGCTSTCNRTLTVNPNPGCEITGNNVICAGASASFTASGGAAGATYAWTGPGGYTANTATISGLTAAGTYTVVVTNPTGCTSTCNRTLTVNPNPGCEITGTNVICAGGSTSFTASGGAAGATYAWTGPGGYTANTATISGLTAAGTYTVVVTNPTGCTSTCNRTLSVNSNPPCEITGNNVICAGGSASFTASGGAAGATYAWTGPGGYTANTATISGLTAAGTYTVVITNTTGCTSTCNRTLTVNPNPGCSITGNNVICAGASTSFTASGGAAGATYAWTGPGGYTANTATISGLTAAGTYTVVVTNPTGCTSTCNRTLTVNPNPGCEITGNNVICAGASASFTASGGAAGATYAWTGPGGYTANTATISGLTAAGTYTVVVTNPTGCTSTCNRTLTVNPNPGCEITGNNVICAGASASFTASGGAAGATYAWTGPGGYTANTATISGLTAAGTYTVVVTNPTGCTSTCNRTLTVNPNPGCEITGNNVICAGGSASFTASGGAAGATYAWTGPGGYTANTATISGLTAAGTYTVVVTNPTGCTSTCNRTLTVNPNPGCSITGNNVICAGASASFTASGGAAGATYAWTGPGGYTANTATISGLTAAGTYTVVVTNPTGCTSTCNRTLTVNPNPGCEITGNNAICVGGSTSFTASGGAAGATYAWTGPGGYTANTATISGLTVAGTYTVVITNTTGCTSTCNRTLTVNPLPVIACTKTPSTIDITSAAHNAQFDVDLTGSADTDPDNYTYAWTEDGTGSFNFSNIKNPVYTAGPLDAGQVVSVTVTVTHKRTGCTSVSECSIPVRAAESCPEVPTSEVCNGSTNTYTAGRAATANETWKWSVNNGASIDGADNAQSVKVIAGSQSFTLTLTISYANTELTPSVCTYEVTVVPCGGYCTYTQGKYGNTSPACDGDGIGDGVAITYPTVVDMIKAMLGVGGVANPLVIGSNGKFITIPATATAAELLNKSMPGGGGSRELFGSCTVDNVPLPACWTPGTNTSTTYITKQGRINNVLLSQTITLGLNLRVSGGLADFALEAGTFATAKADGGCGSTTPKQRSCYFNELGQFVVVNEYVYKTIPQSIIDALNAGGYDHTVGGLYQLANDALGNKDGEAGKEQGASLGDITNAVGSINEGFDECRIFIGWNVGPCEVPSTRININSSGVINSADLAAQTVESLRVSAYPNPFAEKVSFAIVSPVSGKASLEIYNMFGQKIQTVYEGYLTAGRTQLVEFRPGSTIAAGTLVYRLNVAGKQVTGKLVNLKQ